MDIYFANESIMVLRMRQSIYILLFFCIHGCVKVFAQTDTTTITLNQCIAAALGYNPNLKEAGNEVGVSEIAIKTNGSGLYPVVSSEANAGISNEYRLGNNYRTGNANINADQLLWQNGKVRLSVVQAKYLHQASRYNFEARKGDLIVSVKITFFNCLLQDQLYRVAVDNVSKATLFLDYARERYTIGLARKSDVLKAESDLAQSEFDRDSFLNSHKQARNELSMLTGFSNDRLSGLADEGEMIPYNQPDSILSLAFTMYPEMQSIKNINLSQVAKINEETAGFFPQLGIRAGYDWAYNPLIQQQHGWYSLVTFRWTIFNGNDRHYRVQTEQVRKKIYENQADEIRNYLIKEIRNRVIGIKDAENRITLSKRLMKTTSENLEIAKAQYKSGTGSMLELTDARINDLNAKQQNIQAMTAYQIGLANLERLLGNND